MLTRYTRCSRVTTVPCWTRLTRFTLRQTQDMGSATPVKTYKTKNEKHYTARVFFIDVLTCGPTTPVGPGGPVFPWNPCNYRKKISQKHMSLRVCVCKIMTLPCKKKCKKQLWPVLLFDQGDLEVHLSQQDPEHTYTHTCTLNKVRSLEGTSLHTVPAGSCWWFIAAPS